MNIGIDDRATCPRTRLRQGVTTCTPNVSVAGAANDVVLSPVAYYFTGLGIVVATFNMRSRRVTSRKVAHTAVTWPAASFGTAKCWLVTRVALVVRPPKAFMFNVR